MVSASALIEEETKETLSCQVCRQAAHKYQCPKCRVLYCALKCYQSHSTACLEAFSQEQVTQHLKSIKSSPAERTKMNKMLHKHHVQDEDLEESRLCELLEKLEIDDFDQVFSKLTPEERQSFQTFIAKSDAVVLWTPWWQRRDVINDKIELLEEVDSAVNLNELEVEPMPEEATNDTDKDDYEDLPDADEPTLPYASFVAIYLKRRRAIPAFSALLKKPPATTLPFLIASNLASFVFYSRYHNGAILEVDPLRLAAILVAQLLDTENQKTMLPDFESAYFEHLKALKTIGNLLSETIKQY